MISLVNEKRHWPFLLRGRFAVLLTGLCLCGDVHGADSPDNDVRRYGEVKEWVGQFNYTANYSMNAVMGAGTQEVNTNESGSAQFHLNKITFMGEMGAEWEGEGSASATYTQQEIFRGGEVTITTVQHGSASGPAPTNRLTLNFGKEKNFTMISAGVRGGGYTETQTMSMPQKTISHTKQETWSPSMDRLIEKEPLPLPKPGMDLSGTDYVREYRLNEHVELSTTTAHLSGGVSVSWDLAPVWTDVELVVEIEGYDQWMPMATQQGLLAGNFLTVKATLQSKNGQPLGFQAKKITFELKNTSKEPGVCMNWPAKQPDAPKELYDLQFDPTKNVGMELVDPEFQTIATPEGKYVEAGGMIGMQEGGAWADHKVTGPLPDGRTVVGHLKGKDTEILVPIPKRDGNSRVADRWKELNNCRDLTDESDEEHVTGNEHDGDGFSMYEEYRGFYENGKHITLNPKKKELFILDKIKGQSVRGFVTFERGTGIVPHYQLLKTEMPLGREMDFNRSDETPVAYKEMQHGLILTYTFDASASFIDTDNDNSAWVPKHVPFVRITSTVTPYSGSLTSLVRDGSVIISDESGSTIAHELSHACGVVHHGEDDPGMVLWRRDTSVTPHVIREFALDDDGNIDDGDHGKIIRVSKEQGGALVDVPPDRKVFDHDLTLYLAACRNGQHSGAEECYMRYDCASAYVNPKRADGRVKILDGEVSGWDLCDNKKGTGVNDRGRKPVSRYGDAEKGDCKSQVNCVDGSVP